MKFEDFDVLAKPVTKPTKSGTALTFFTISCFLAYATYAVFQAATTLLSKTSIAFTKSNEIGKTIPLNFKCPSKAKSTYLILHRKYDYKSFISV